MNKLGVQDWFKAIFQNFKGFAEDIYSIALIFASKVKSYVLTKTQFYVSMKLLNIL